MPQRDITLSVVSHAQNALVNRLLEDVGRASTPAQALTALEIVPAPSRLALLTLEVVPWGSVPALRRPGHQGYTFSGSPRMQM
jgi:hypothetical protein